MVFVLAFEFISMSYNVSYVAFKHQKKTILHGWPGVLFKECLQLDLLQVLLCLDDGGDG